MRKILCTLFVVIFTFTLIRPQEARAELPVKARAFLTIAGYGTAGGALLGAASMAFGTSARAIPQGASLGLYAGILFGTYVLVSHHNKRYGSYDDNASPYGESSDIYGDEYQEDDGGSRNGRSSRGFFDRFETMQDKFGDKKRGSQMPPLYLNLLNYQF
jgi:hypothetical protein